MRAALALAGLLYALVAPAAAGEPDLVVVVHPSSQVTKLSASELEAIFTSVQRTWLDGKPVVAFNYAPQDPLRVHFERVVLRMTPEEVGRFWVDQRVRGAARPPRQVADPTLALRLVGKLPGSVAYLPANLVDSSVRVVARVRGDKVIEQ